MAEWAIEVRRELDRQEQSSLVKWFEEAVQIRAVNTPT